MTTWPNGRKTPDPVTAEHASLGGYPGHNGIDLINCDDGLNWSPLGGVVIFAGYNGTAGNEVRERVNCPHGCVIRELHIAPGGIRVGVGQVVGERAPLGATGTTGQSSGVHCHYECWWAGDRAQVMEPRQWMALHGLAPAGGGSTPITEPITRKRDDQMEAKVLNIIPETPTFMYGPGYCRSTRTRRVFEDWLAAMYYPSNTIPGGTNAATVEEFYEQLRTVTFMPRGLRLGWEDEWTAFGGINGTGEGALVRATLTTAQVNAIASQIKVDPAALALAVDTALDDEFAGMDAALTKINTTLGKQLTAAQVVSAFAQSLGNG